MTLINPFSLTLFAGVWIRKTFQATKVPFSARTRTFGQRNTSDTNPGKSDIKLFSPLFSHTSEPSIESTHGQQMNPIKYKLMTIVSSQEDERKNLEVKWRAEHVWCVHHNTEYNFSISWSFGRVSSSALHQFDFLVSYSYKNALHKRVISSHRSIYTNKTRSARAHTYSHALDHNNK